MIVFVGSDYQLLQKNVCGAMVLHATSNSQGPQSHNIIQITWLDNCNHRHMSEVRIG